jgi:hypothetical protein
MFQGIFRDSSVIVVNEHGVSSLLSQGIGELTDGVLLLSDEEAFFLRDCGLLQFETLSNRESLLQIFLQKNSCFLKKFAVYKYFKFKKLDIYEMYEFFIDCLLATLSNQAIATGWITAFIAVL